jgi:hypothetical protein
MNIGKEVGRDIGRHCWSAIFDEQWETTYCRVDKVTWVIVHDITWIPVNESIMNTGRINYGVRASNEW